MCQGVPEKQVALATSQEKKDPWLFSHLRVRGTTYICENKCVFLVLRATQKEGTGCKQVEWRVPKKLCIAFVWRMPTGYVLCSCTGDQWTDWCPRCVTHSAPLVNDITVNNHESGDVAGCQDEGECSRSGCQYEDKWDRAEASMRLVRQHSSTQTSYPRNHATTAQHQQQQQQHSGRW